MIMVLGFARVYGVAGKADEPPWRREALGSILVVASVRLDLPGSKPRPVSGPLNWLDLLTPALKLAACMKCLVQTLREPGQAASHWPSLLLVRATKNEPPSCDGQKNERRTIRRPSRSGEPSERKQLFLSAPS